MTEKEALEHLKNEFKEYPIFWRELQEYPGMLQLAAKAVMKAFHDAKQIHRATVKDPRGQWWGWNPGGYWQKLYLTDTFIAQTHQWCNDADCVICRKRLRDASEKFQKNY